MTQGRDSFDFNSLLPWTDRAGRLSPLKLAAFIGILLPGILLAYGLATGTLGAKPVTQAILEAGDWAIRFLFLSLLVTPLRRIAGWSKLINIRRHLGLAALGYGLLHLGFYAADQAWDLGKVASEIVLRIYLTIGFVALLAMTALGVTSTDGAIRRMGQGWHRLHKATYAIAVLATIHFFLQSKSDVSQATLMAGFFVALMSYRIAQKRGFRLTSLPVLIGIATVSGLATAGIEYAWYALATGIPPLRVLQANLDFSYSIRPAWWVAFTGLAIAAVPLLVLARDKFRQAFARPASMRA